MASKGAPAPQNQPVADPSFYLKVRLNCCSACPRRAKKKLQKLNGVVAIKMDTNEGLVAVTGSVDPGILIAKFAKWGKQAVIWSPPKNPMQTAQGNTYFNHKNNNNNKIQHAKIDQDSRCCCCQDNSDSDSDSDNDHDNDCDECVSKSHKSTITWQHPDFLKKTVATASASTTKKAKKPCWLLRLCCTSKYGAKLQGPNAKSKDVTAASASTSKTLPAIGNRFPTMRPIMPEYGVPRPYAYYPSYGERSIYGSQYYRPTMYGSQAVPPYTYHPTMHQLPPSPRPMPPYVNYEPRPPPQFNPMIHYTRYEDNYRPTF